MIDFKKQIQEDIAEYQQKFLFMPNIHNDVTPKSWTV